MTMASTPIAIIGMSCRFPGDATSLEKLWQLCAEGRSAWSQIPQSRFNQEAFYNEDSEKIGRVHEDHKYSRNVKAGS